MKKIFKALLVVILFAFTISFYNVKAQELELVENESENVQTDIMNNDDSESNRKEEVAVLENEQADEETKEEVNDDESTVGKVTVKIIDSRTGDVAKTVELYADATKDTIITLSDILPGFSYDTKNKVFYKDETLYKYTFVGLFDAEQNGTQITFNYNPNTIYPELSKLNCASNATGAANYKLSLRAKSDLTTEKTIYIYAIVNTLVKPNGKVTINFVDTRTGDSVGSIFSFATDSSTAKIKLTELFTINSSWISEYNGRKYKFIGFFTEEEGGQQLTDDNSLANNYSELETLKTTSSSSTANYRVQAKTDKNYDGEKTITLYARWELQKQRQKLTVNYYDVKVKDDGTTEVTKVKSVSQDVDPGVTWTQEETLDQIFSEKNTSRPYSGVHDENSNTETDSNHIYTFLGWYDKAEGGNQITGDYTLTGDYAKALQNLSTYGNFVISFTSTTGLDADYELNVYGYWDSVKTPELKMKNVNEVSHEGNTSWENSNGTASSYTHTYTNPTDGPSTHEFKYWKVYKVNEETNEETEYDGIEYIEGTEHNKFNYSFEGKEPGSIEVLVGRAWWQANVTLVLLDGSKELGRDSSFESIKISNILEKDPTKEGYKFLGWTDEDGNDVDKDAIYEPNEVSTNPEAKLVKLYAKWQKLISISITKEWDDQDNEDEIRPDSVTVYLYADEEKIMDVEITSETWNVIIDNLPADKTYTVVEGEVEYYESTVTGDQENGFVVKNYHEVGGKGEGEDPDEPTVKPVNNDVTDNPKTGDNIFISITMLFISTFGLITTAYLKKYSFNK